MQRTNNPTSIRLFVAVAVLVLATGCEFLDDGAGAGAGAGPGGSSDPCFAGIRAGTSLIECDDISYYLTVPDSCPDDGCGLIADVHGSTMSGQMQDNNTELRRLAPDRGFIVFQPNDAAAAPASQWSEQDAAIVLAAFDRVQNALDVDPSRVHLTGFSDGGMMAWEILCAGTGRFASFAPAGASADQACVPLGGLVEVGGCMLTNPSKTPDAVDILFMAGKHDALVDFSCSQTQANSVVDHFGLGNPTAVDQGTGFIRTRYSGSGIEFDFLVHEYVSPVSVLAGHCYPGSQDLGDEPGQLFSFACEDSEFHWGEVVVEFFDSHRKP